LANAYGVSIKKEQCCVAIQSALTRDKRTRKILQTKLKTNFFMVSKKEDKLWEKWKSLNQQSNLKQKTGLQNQSSKHLKL
jgi:hypothetical protein